MIILIPYQIGPIGGPYTFVRAITTHLKSRGHTVINQPRRNYDTLLIIAECPLWLVLQAKITGKKIVQRLDGVYHPGLSSLNRYLYWLRNLRMKIIHNYFADHVIYQSKFAKHSCETMLGKPTGATSIIYNGVKPEARIRMNRSPLKLITAANFRRRDQIEPILSAIKFLDLPYQLDVYGPHHDRLAGIFAAATHQSHVHLRGSVSFSQLQQALRHSDIFLFSDQSACPNVVLEALAAGLPVVAFDRGSISELITSGQSGEVVPLPNHRPFHHPYPFTPPSFHHLAQAIQTVASRLPPYKAAALQSAKTKYDINSMFESYEATL